MNRPDQLTPLSDLPGLREWCSQQCFDLEDVHADQALVVNRESGSQWSLQRVEDWLQVKGWVLPDVAAGQALAVTLARLHDRPLGCRFAIDEDNNLCVLVDLFPHDQSGASVGAAIMQSQCVVDVAQGLFRRVQETGLAADEPSIDQAFGEHDRAALH